MSVRLRGEVWYAILYAGRVNGRDKQDWIRLEGATTREEALAMERELKRQRSKRHAITLGDYLLLWLDEWEGSPKTLESYREQCNNHIIPALGDIRLNVLKPSDLKRYYAAKRKEVSPKTGKVYSGTTVNYHHRILRAALNVAVDDDRYPLEKNPANKVDAPRKSDYEAPLWTEEEAQRFLQVIVKHRDFAAYAMAVLTGMRRGEVFGMHLRNMSFETIITKDEKELRIGTLRVRDNLVYVKNKPLLRPAPKSASGRRNIAIGPALVAIIEQHLQNLEERRKAEGWQEHGLVFPNRIGAYIDPHNVSARQFPQLCKKAGVPRIPFHSVRHTNLTSLIESGVDDSVAQQRAGHSSIRVTRDFYGHVRVRRQREAAIVAEKRLLGDVSA